ncbi:MAG: beta-ketoacyl-ACP synthase, partial [Microcoleus sp.]
MDVVVTGIGLVSALGTLDCSWKRLLSGESGIRQHQPFIELERRPLALIGTKPVDLISLIRQVLADALQDANLTLPLLECGIAIGSSRGFQANLELLAREGRGKKEEGRRKKEEEREFSITDSQCPMPNAQFPMP